MSNLFNPVDFLQNDGSVDKAIIEDNLRDDTMYLSRMGGSLSSFLRVPTLYTDSIIMNNQTMTNIFTTEDKQTIQDVSTNVASINEHIEILQTGQATNAELIDSLANNSKFLKTDYNPHGIRSTRGLFVEEDMSTRANVYVGKDLLLMNENINTVTRAKHMPGHTSADYCVIRNSENSIQFEVDGKLFDFDASGQMYVPDKVLCNGICVSDGIFDTSFKQNGKTLTINGEGTNGVIEFDSEGVTIMRINPENIDFKDKELRNVLSIKYEDNTEQFTAFTEEHVIQLNASGNDGINSDIITLQDKTANLNRLHLPESDLGPEFDQLTINAPDNIILKTGIENGVEIITDRIKFGNRIITQCPTITDIKDDIAGINGNITGINGNITGINGNITGINGNIAGITNDITNITNITGKFNVNGTSLVISTKDLDLNNNDIKNVNTYEIGSSGLIGYITKDTNNNIEIKSVLDQNIILSTIASNSSDYSPGPHKLTISTPMIDLGDRTILNCPTIDTIYNNISSKPSYAKCRITVNSSNQYIYDWHSSNLRTFVNSSVYVSKQSTGLITLMLDTEENGGPSDDHFVVTGNGRQYGNADFSPRRGIFFTVIYKSAVYSSGSFKGHTVQLQLVRSEGIDEVYDLIYYNSTHQGWLDLLIAW